MSAAIAGNDDFEAAFARLSAPDAPVPPPDAAPAPEPAPEPAGEPAPAPDPEPAVPAATPSEPGEPAPAPEAPPAPAPAPVEAKADPDEELLNRFADIVKRKAAPEPVKQEPQKQPEPEAIYSPDETEFLGEYEKDWSDVSKGEALKRRAEYRNLVQFVFTEVGKELGPLLETVQALAQKTALTDLRSSVTDYDTVRERVVEWVGKQPTYLQVAYDHVIKNGTSEEVVDLVDRWRRDTGTAAAAPPSPAKTALPTATKQAAAALAPVASKRSQVLQGDPVTFEDAFAQFASKM